MSIVRHVARAHGSTGSAAPAYRVEIRADTHQLVADEPASAGGGDVGPSPFGLLLSGLVACTATTLRMYAEHKGWELRSIAVDVRYDVGDDGSRHIERTVTVPADLTDEQRESLVAMAERTPVTKAIQGATPISTTFRADPTV